MLVHYRRKENRMKISTKGRYALRVMLDIAQNSNGEFISLRDISQRQEISMKYLEMIIGILNRGSKFRKCCRIPFGNVL